MNTGNTCKIETELEKKKIFKIKKDELLALTSRIVSFPLRTGVTCSVM